MAAAWQDAPTAEERDGGAMDGVGGEREVELRAIEASDPGVREAIVARLSLSRGRLHVSPALASLSDSPTLTAGLDTVSTTVDEPLLADPAPLPRPRYIPAESAPSSPSAREADTKTSAVPSSASGACAAAEAPNADTLDPAGAVNLCEMYAITDRMLAQVDTTLRVADATLRAGGRGVWGPALVLGA